MGLIKTGIQMGGAYAIASQVTKAYGKHQQSNAQQQPQQPQQLQPSYPQQGQMRSSSPSASQGYVHQYYCTGQCGGQCNGNNSSSNNNYANTNRGTAPEYYASQERLTKE